MKLAKHTQRTWCALAALLIMTSPAWAAPVLQVYIPGSTAGDAGADENTWITTSSTFNLQLVGTLHGNTLLHGTLVASVPQGETGTLTIDALPPLTTTAPTAQGNNPNGDANVNALANIPGTDAYATKAALPSNFDNHFPFQNDVADFILYDVGGFSGEPDAISDFDAETGTITPSDHGGQIKTFPVSVSGFSWVHFDFYGFQDRTTGADAWTINSGGHDAAFYATTPPPGPIPIPAPGALILGGLGAALVSWLRRRHAF